MMMNNFVFLIAKNSEFENAFNNKKRPFLTVFFVVIIIIYYLFYFYYNMKY